MRLSLAMLAAAVTISVAAVPVQAGLTAEDNVLYSHGKNCGGDGETTYWMNPSRDDAAHEDGSCGPVTTDPVRGYTWSMPMDPELEEAVQLEPDGVINLTAYFSFVGATQVEVDTKLTAGDDVVADPDPEFEGWVGAGGFQTSWEVEPQVDRLPAGASVEWTVSVSGVAGPVALSMDGDRWSRVTLPIPNGTADASPATSTSEESPDAPNGSSPSEDPETTSPAPGESVPGFSATGLAIGAAVAWALRRRD